MLLTIYFWLMLAYVAGTLLVTPFAVRRLQAAGYTRGMWVEQAASYALMALGLAGLYGHLNQIALISAPFWQALLVVLVVFSGLQHRMPKTRLLRRTHGPRAVWMATGVGALLLLPMVVGLYRYGFAQPAVWHTPPTQAATGEPGGGARGG